MRNVYYTRKYFYDYFLNFCNSLKDLPNCYYYSCVEDFDFSLNFRFWYGTNYDPYFFSLDVRLHNKYVHFIFNTRSKAGILNFKYSFDNCIYYPAEIEEIILSNINNLLDVT